MIVLTEIPCNSLLRRVRGYIEGVHIGIVFIGGSIMAGIDVITGG